MQIITDQFQKERKEHGDFSFPFLISYEKLSKYETGAFLWHWHPAIELTLVTKGQMVYKVNNQVFHLHQEEVLFGNAGTLHAGQMYQNQDCEYTSITFDPKLIYGYENSIVYRKYIKPMIQNVSLAAVHFNISEEWHREVINMVKNIIRIESQKYATYELDILMGLYRFWQQLYLHNQKLPQSMENDKYNYERIRKILSYIELNYASKLTLAEIAAHVHLCKEECSRIFKKSMKVSLFEFILEYRIEKSIEYLIDTRYSIMEVAEAVGFHDSNYFTKVFRRQKGCSPTKYRKSIRSK